MHSILSRLMGISALKLVLKNIGNSRRNRQNFAKNINKFERTILKLQFLHKCYLLLKIQPFAKMQQSIRLMMIIEAKI